MIKKLILAFALIFLMPSLYAAEPAIMPEKDVPKPAAAISPVVNFDMNQVRQKREVEIRDALSHIFISEIMSFIVEYAYPSICEPLIIDGQGKNLFLMIGTCVFSGPSAIILSDNSRQHSLIVSITENIFSNRLGVLARETGVQSLEISSRVDKIEARRKGTGAIKGVKFPNFSVNTTEEGHFVALTGQVFESNAFIRVTNFAGINLTVGLNLFTGGLRAGSAVCDLLGVSPPAGAYIAVGGNQIAGTQMSTVKVSHSIFDDVDDKLSAVYTSDTLAKWIGVTVSQCVFISKDGKTVKVDSYNAAVPILVGNS